MFIRGGFKKKSTNMKNKKILKQKKGKKKRKRMEKRNHNIDKCEMKIFAANAAGIRCKIKSFDQIISNIAPKIWMLEETKLKPNETMKCDSSKHFNVFYLNRQNAQGGGLAIGVHKEIESALVREGNDETETLSVQAVLGKIKVRIIVAHGPQENASILKKQRFWEAIEKEVCEADIEGHGVLRWQFTWW